jgi:beta-glucosidase
MQRPVFLRFLRFLSPLVWIVLILAMSIPSVNAQSVIVDRPWMNTALTPDQRAEALLAQMTLAQKLQMLSGVSGSYVGNTPAIPSLGIPALNLEDGPAGVADGMTGVTAFPAPVGVAASWDTSLMNQYGQDLGGEEAGKGANIVLAPTVNILRNPQWGRSFESLGEDPYLTSQLGVADIEGIQSQHVIATVKHFAANNQEYDRTTVSANVDQRTLQEIYLPAFQAAVQQGNVGAVMCSYNQINDIYACEQPYLLNDVLKAGWNFPGFVMSDWGATHSTLQAAAAGLDMQMPDGSYYGSALQTDEQNGLVSIQTINEMVERVLRTMFADGLFDYPLTGTPSSNVATTADNQFTEQASEQGTVLLQNTQSILPLKSSSISSIAVIGSDASDSPMIAGNGSAHVNASTVVTPLQGITARAGSGVNVQYVDGTSANGEPAITSQYLTPSSGSGSGLYGQFYNNMTLSGTPVLTRTDAQLNFNWNGGSPASGVAATQWSAKWTGTITAPQTGTYTFSLNSDDGSRLFINNQEVINNWQDQASNTETGTVSLTAGQSYPVEVDYYQDGGASNLTLGWLLPDGSNSPVNQAANLAKSSSVAVVFANDIESEGSDRTSLSLPNNQDQLIEAVAQANPHTIVVLNTGAPVLMPWESQVQGIVEAWYPGQEDGNAIAAVLFGDVNPSGKLPMTFPASASQVPANTQAQYPGINDQGSYSEGLDVGYRYYDANNLTPLFPFGYGLSYTTFAYSNIAVSPGSGSFNGNVTVTATVKNTGSVAGSDVAQLYMNFPTSSGEPPEQLKGFQKVTLSPGQSQTVSFALNSRAFSYWDTTAQQWVVPQGTFQIKVGDSSRNLPLTTSYQVTTPSYNALQQAFNNVGTSDNSNPTAANYDGSGYSYSAQALAAAGLTPGATVTHNGVSFTWPNVASGQANNVEANGQTIMYSGAGDTLGFLGAAAFGTQSGTGTITYTDGSTQSFTLNLADWYANAPASGDDLVATASNWNVPAGSTSGNHAVSVYYTSVPLSPTKALLSVTLPTNSKMHIFAMGLNSLQQAYNNVGISANSNPTPGNYDGHGYSYSAQALSAAGMTPGSLVSHDGVLFTWPNVPVGTPDNVVAAGQTLAMSGSGSILAILGAGGFGTQSGTATITYTDGTTQTFTLSFADWYANEPVAGTEIAATTTNWNVPAGDTLGSHQVSIYYSAVPLQSGKTVASVTLPSNSNLHLFAMTVQ